MAYPTFEAYCTQRWNMARRTAYRLIDAADVVGNVSHGTQPLPANEAQTRELSGLAPNEQRAVGPIGAGPVRHGLCGLVQA